MALPVIRAGMVGSGFAARFHYESARRVAGFDVRVVGVYSPTESHRNVFASEREIPAFSSYEELLSASDVVHICVPTAFHERYTVEALNAGVFPIVEKPLTGYFSDTGEVDGESLDKSVALQGALDSLGRMREAEAASSAVILYAENWVYAPSIQKEREIIEKTDAQILWMMGEESHSGSHSSAYGKWSMSGGGVMLSKGCHPLTGALYLKRVEGRMRGAPIRPATITARHHAVTRSAKFRDRGHVRTGYTDIDDLSLMHIVFDDGTVADIVASDVVLGGIHNEIEVAANNHRTVCNINPSDAMRTYNPDAGQFDRIYIVEKLGTKQGWMNPAPDEDWATGYPGEIEAFYRTVAFGEVPESGSALGTDAIATIYAGYLSAERGGAETPIPLPGE